MFLKSMFQKILRKEKGAVIVMTAVMIPIIFGMAGMGYDVGNLYTHKSRLQNIADAAAYAGSGVYYNYVQAYNNDSSIVIPNADDYSGNTLIASDHNDNRETADAAAREYITKNQGVLTLADPEIYALKGKVPVVGSNDTVNGIYYRVRVSEEVPLHFLPLIPGIGNTQTVTADGTVAFSTDTSTSTTETQTGYFTTEYTNIYKNLFSSITLTGYDGGGSGSVYKTNSSAVLDEFAFMFWRFTQGAGKYMYTHTTNTINAGTQTDGYNQKTLNSYYNYLGFNSRDSDTKNNKYVYLSNVILGSQFSTYTININNTLQNYGTHYGYLSSNSKSTTKNFTEKMPLYIFQKYNGNAVINVTNNKNENCFPIVYVQRPQNNSASQMAGANNTLTLNINSGQVFRGVIYAPYGTVTVNNYGKFYGSIVAANVVSTGTGTYTSQYYFTDTGESGGNDLNWITEFIETTSSVEDNGDFTEEEVRALLKSFLNYLYTCKAELTYDAEGTALGSDGWHTYHYEGLKIDKGVYPNSLDTTYKYYSTSNTDYTKDSYSEDTTSSKKRNKDWTWSNSTTSNRLRRNGGYVDFYGSTTQDWFENLTVVQKGRLADQWDRYKTLKESISVNGKTLSSEDLMWVWTQGTTVEVEGTTTIVTTEAVKSYLMVWSERTSNPNNPFEANNL